MLDETDRVKVGVWRKDVFLDRFLCSDFVIFWFLLKLCLVLGKVCCFIAFANARANTCDDGFWLIRLCLDCLWRMFGNDCEELAPGDVAAEDES